MSDREISKTEYLKLYLKIQEHAAQIKGRYMSNEISAKEAFKLISVYEEFSNKCKIDGYHVLIDQIENYLKSVRAAIEIREAQRMQGVSK